jgi:hypothetical protein
MLMWLILSRVVMVGKDLAGADLKHSDTLWSSTQNGALLEEILMPKESRKGPLVRDTALLGSRGRIGQHRIINTSGRPATAPDIGNVED